MPRLKYHVPKYSRHKASGQARVLVRGKHHYLGPYGSVESKARYEELVKEFLEARNRKDAGVTVSQVAAAFWRFAKQRYGSKGKGKYGDAVVWRPVLRLLRKIFGKTLARDFGPRSLQKVQAAMVELDWSRGYANDQLVRCRRAFKWAAAQELVPYCVYEQLLSVEGLRRGEARESPPIDPVSDTVVEETLQYLPEKVRAMVQLQRFAGMRPGEVIIIRPTDIDRSSETWVYTPTAHKNLHRGKARRIHFGPKAQSVLTPYLQGKVDRWCFATRGSRHYTTDSFRRAIHRACERAYKERRRVWLDNNPGANLGDYPEPLVKWSPNQLRKAAATSIRDTFDVESAAAVLGHSSSTVTGEHYAALSERRAKDAAMTLG